jgi:hypothetical protein
LGFLHSLVAAGLGRGAAVVDHRTMPVSPGTVSTVIDYGQLMMRSAMDEVTTRDPQGGTVIAMRTRPLLRRSR